MILIIYAYDLFSFILQSSINIPKKNKKKTSNQKAQEEYEQIQARRAAKKQVRSILKIFRFIFLYPKCICKLFF